MHVAVLAPPLHGHVTPTLGVVQQLTSRGHRVSFLSSEEFAPALQAVGARVVPVPAIPQRTISATGTTGSALASIRNLLLARDCRTVTTAVKAFGDDRPDVVLYNFVERFAGRTLARYWGGRAARYFPTYAITDALPLAEVFPASGNQQSGPASPESRNKAAAVQRSLGLPVEESSYDLLAEEELNLVFLPSAFQPHSEALGSGYHFVGPIMTGRSSHGSWTPPHSGRPVLYVSLGTLRVSSPDFFREALAAFAEEDLHLVMSIGTVIDPADLGPLPPHCEVHAHLPQLEVLRHTSVFVTHGGMNSTMEALTLGVPLVVVPQMPEQEATARRVADLGLGVHLPPAKVTPETLRAAVRQIRDDLTYADAAAAFGSRAGDGGGAPAVADALESLVAS
ncbi:MAG: hypothetical protein QG622_2938 [Actinomycetota bacterium]|nr:hypothetical protein [Actinomycetota bacterium]